MVSTSSGRFASSHSRSIGRSSSRTSPSSVPSLPGSGRVSSLLRRFQRAAADRGGVLRQDRFRCRCRRGLGRRGGRGLGHLHRGIELGICYRRGLGQPIIQFQDFVIVICRSGRRGDGRGRPNGTSRPGLRSVALFGDDPFDGGQYLLHRRFRADVPHVTHPVALAQRRHWRFGEALPVVNAGLLSTGVSSIGSNDLVTAASCAGVVAVVAATESGSPSPPKSPNLPRTRL